MGGGEEGKETQKLWEKSVAPSCQASGFSLARRVWGREEVPRDPRGFMGRG